ncbi:MAG TPA: TetR family transcriptional regulator [Stellaceae bacterium]|nr:TetR family transcriptional regulator [Stellaceae bacterium]
MARTRAPRKQHADGTPENRLIDAALALAARQGWRRTSLAEIAEEAGLKLHEAYALHRSKGAILAAFVRRTDLSVLEGAAPDAHESARERLFDTMMRRFDALKPHRGAVRAIVRDGIGHPSSLLGMALLKRSMRWMLEASDISTVGCKGRLLIQGTMALHLSVLRVFLADDSADLARTMAALDRGLRRGESLCRLLPRGRRKAEATAA